ncbi:MULTISPECIES: hypothetical protein [Chryseobacterium]|uniref:Uncharacterized protein n=1 Tax=Chryseobacterium bernardetii TaxID=1241978 RepID=A0A3G6TZU9_9FLAO|nr:MULTISPECIES: hypothetical protein [Chryseobacterium]AZB26833.1 hypothetical protein EG339_20705 [Chryseobacterium bernardetii]AZB33309.1 hypothetical protein EG351_06540 [Chryseobacterium bernardetii]UCA61126.1 hypothetical protein KB553_06235 [Chryseobacterium rhizoplanae]
MELPKNAVSLEDAIRWTKRWQLKELTSGVEIKAHMIPSKDAFDIFYNDKGFKNYRGYNAINDEGVFKFLLVGVDDDGNDIVDYSNGDYIYDMTTPCPSVCSKVVWWEQ